MNIFKNTIVSLVVGMAITFTAATASQAATVSYNFEANVSLIQNGLTSVSVNDTVTGTVSYSDTGDNILFSTSSQTRYDADVALSFSVNGKNGSSSENPFSVINHSSSDRFFIESAPGTFDSSAVAMSLVFNGGPTVISGTALPSELFLTGWSNVYLLLMTPATVGGPGPGGPGPGGPGPGGPGAPGSPPTAPMPIFQAELTSLTRVSTVPLPAGLPLYGAGLAVMGFIGWRRSRKAAA